MSRGYRIAGEAEIAGRTDHAEHAEHAERRRLAEDAGDNQGTRVAAKPRQGGRVAAGRRRHVNTPPAFFFLLPHARQPAALRPSSCPLTYADVVMAASPLSRRQFIGVTLLGLTRKSGRRIEGDLVHESWKDGHRLRDGGPFSPPREQRRAAIVIVGGGIAGLSAAWRLHKRGIRDFVVLEMEAEAGGNARSGHNDVSAYPWAAHYVPVPGPESTLVRELFTELGVLGADGTWREEDLCQAPQERLFIHGRWQEGLEPRTGPGPRDRDQFRRFDDRMQALRATRAFTIPMALGAPANSPLDTLSMAAWLDREGFDSPWLRWSVDYACRDDYGAAAGDVSAWAGVHYFASRVPDDPGPLTWPQGNGWITARLLERVGAFVHTGHMVHRIDRQGRRWRVLSTDVEWTADAVIFAAPSFLASRVIDGGPPTPDFVYSPWLTANLTLDRWPKEKGIPPAWDNVIFDSPGLGYVVDTHQSLRTFIPRTVWTYYRSFAGQPPGEARRWLLSSTWETFRDAVLDDLSRAHPDLREVVTRVDVCRMGHAMIRPTPGFLASSARHQLRAARDGLFYAHSDLSGLSLFEEAQFRGVTAADGAIGGIGE
jgi:glycine/D-amino acid oxidase-like deaminating enzyme